jgi:hypothetical protein
MRGVAMNSTVVVTPWGESELVTGSYDLFVATVGFESRARHIAETMRPRAAKYVASAFESRQELAFLANRKWFQNAGFQVPVVSDSEFLEHCQEVLSSIEVRGQKVRVCIDISSMSRLRMATWVSAVRNGVDGRSVVADFVYAPAVFSGSPGEHAPIVVSKPVVDEFAGWSAEPDKPSVAILGVGYERDKAVGAVQYLEPAAVWVFKPLGQDSRYEPAMERANQALWGVVPEENVLEYPVEKPFEAFMAVEALTFGLLRRMRPVLVPFGPKVFSLCCLLVACVHFPEVAVWRVSSGSYEPAVDRVAQGRVVGIRAEFGPAPNIEAGGEV